MIFIIALIIPFVSGKSLPPEVENKYHFTHLVDLLPGGGMIHQKYWFGLDPIETKLNEMGGINGTVKELASAPKNKHLSYALNIKQAVSIAENEYVASLYRFNELKGMVTSTMSHREKRQLGKCFDHVLFISMLHQLSQCHWQTF